MTTIDLARPQLLIKEAREITADWLGAVLGVEDLALVSSERVGTGQMSQNHRVTYTGADDVTSSVIVKLASDDAQSRSTGVSMGAYLREIAFYNDLAKRIGGPIPQCHLAEYDTQDGWFTLVLVDIADAQVGDQIAGCTVDQARIAMRTLAQVHAPVFNDIAVGTTPYLTLPNPFNQALLQMLLPGFLERYAHRVTPEQTEVLERFGEVTDAWLADRRPPMGLVHGDYRLDNLLFTETAATVVDWQTLGWGSAMLDVSYFLGAGLDPVDRKAHERQLVGVYLDELRALGVANLDDEACWEEYRRQVFYGLMMTVIASMVVARTDRGDEMFLTSLDRFSAQAIDLDSVSLLPAPGSVPTPLRPQASDEGRHDPGAEITWNESWYFDAVDASGELGVYVRLGRMPNQDCSVYMASITRPGHPVVMFLDTAAPLPPREDDQQRVVTDELRAEQACIEPLTRFRVSVSGTGRSHDDPAAPLRAEEGVPVPFSIDLEWETDGIPYAWRGATRYEIPCRVSGTVSIDGETLTLSGPGQRDHSWGARDWWAADWMWSAFHLEDGTHTHSVTVPTMPGYGVGYVQQGEELVELTSATTTQEATDDGLLIAAATLVSSPPELTLQVEPIAFGPLRLVAPDGRVTHFPRTMARVRTPDGRSGLGWIEWNQNQPVNGPQ